MLAPALLVLDGWFYVWKDFLTAFLSQLFFSFSLSIGGGGEKDLRLCIYVWLDDEERRCASW